MALADSLRRRFPAARQGSYLDTAAYGLLPDCAREQMQSCWGELLQQGRLDPDYRERIDEAQAQVRQQLAHLLHAEAEAFALTEGPVQALHLALWAWPLQAGDEVVHTGIESAESLLPLYVQKLRRGVVLQRVPAEAAGEAWLRAVEQALTPRTRLVVCAHVAHGSGMRLPVEALVRAVHERGAHLVVDGTLGAGADRLDLAQSGIDAYVLSGHQWLCGPDGTGALYVRPPLLSLLDPVWPSSAGLRSPRDLDEFGMFLGASGARRLEGSHSALAHWLGWLASLRLLRSQAGWEYLWERVRGLSGALWEALLNLPGAELLTPREARAGVVSFRWRGEPPAGLVAEARERQLYLGLAPDGSAVRASLAVYNTEDDVQRLVQWLARRKG